MRSVTAYVRTAATAETGGMVFATHRTQHCRSAAGRPNLRRIFTKEGLTMRGIKKLARSLAVAGLLVLSVGPLPVAASCFSSVLTAGTTYNTGIYYGGLYRTYTLQVPPGYNPANKHWLVIDAHGLGGNGAAQKSASGWAATAWNTSMIAAWPDGYYASWNGYGGVGSAYVANLDDDGLMSAIALTTAGQGNVDMARIYMTGHSNGALLTHRVGCEQSWLFAAISAVAAPLNTTYNVCNTTKPTTVLQFAAYEDAIVPYYGGYNPLLFMTFQSAPDSAWTWYYELGCTGFAATECYSADCSNRCDRAINCTGNATSTLCSVHGDHWVYGYSDVPGYSSARFYSSPKTTPYLQPGCGTT